MKHPSEKLCKAPKEGAFAKVLYRGGFTNSLGLCKAPKEGVFQSHNTKGTL